MPTPSHSANSTLNSSKTHNKWSIQTTAYDNSIEFLGLGFFFFRWMVVNRDHQSLDLAKLLLHGELRTLRTMEHPDPESH
jgi:hypothetical protein